MFGENKNFKLLRNESSNAECKNKPLCQKLNLATKQSFATENNIQQ